MAGHEPPQACGIAAVGRAAKAAAISSSRRSSLRSPSRAPPNSRCTQPATAAGRLPHSRFKAAASSTRRKTRLSRHGAGVSVVLAAAPGGQADLDPVGRAIDGARAWDLDVGLHQPRRDAVAVRQSATMRRASKAQHVRRQVLHHDPGHDQEAAVADDARSCSPRLPSLQPSQSSRAESRHAGALTDRPPITPSRRLTIR